MQLKITTDYAIRTIVCLASRPHEILSTNEVAEAMKIPRKYLIQIGTLLKSAGLIESYPGKLGGYRLAKAPGDICLYDIITAVEDTLKLNRCLEADEYCSRCAVACCPVRPVYTKMQAKWEAELKATAVADLLNTV